ncbi:MAG: NCS2 family permease [Saprospiraceae bacterium]|nr:NCS2 family permease [Saprospiraceae bacterium]
MMLERFKLKENTSSVKSEFIGGLTTFLTMVYVVFVHPSILAEAGMDKESLITVTCLLIFASTMLVGIWANVPFAMAPGMGLNAFFTYSVVIGEGIPWQTALGIVFLSGLLFLLLTLIGVRQKIVDAIPLSLRSAMGAGIGLFITLIGLRKMKLVVDSPATLLTLGDFSEEVIIGCLALLMMVILDIRKIKGAILWGIGFGTIAGFMFVDLQLPDSMISLPPSIDPVFFQLDVVSALKWSLVSVIFTFMFIDLFDSIGTILACSFEAGLIKKDQKLPQMSKVLKADAVATIAGALMGSSTTTTYIESASGIAAGGRTGLSSVFTAILFLFTLFLSPLIAVVPEYAVAPALVFVGVLMIRQITAIDLNNLREAFPAFLTIVLMPLTYSISTGLAFGFISYTLVALLTGKGKDISVVLWFIALGALAMLLLKGH